MIGYSQLSQSRENSTSAVSIYSPNAGQTVQAFVKITNVDTVNVECRVFHDNDGTTYDQTTALVYDMRIQPGQILEIDHILMDNENGNLAYRSSVANALVATVYGIIKS